MRARTGPLRVGKTVALVASIVIGCASPLPGGPAGSGWTGAGQCGLELRKFGLGLRSSASSSPSGATASRRASASPSVTRAPSANGRRPSCRAMTDGEPTSMPCSRRASGPPEPLAQHGPDHMAGGGRRGEGRDPRPDRRQALAELIRLAAMPGWGGRDGHTGIFPFIPGSGTHEYPIRLWRFSDGLVITDARPPYADLIGSRVDALEGQPIDDIMALVEPLAPRDNPSNLTAYGPLYLRVSRAARRPRRRRSAGPRRSRVDEPRRATSRRSYRTDLGRSRRRVAWRCTDAVASRDAAVADQDGDPAVVVVSAGIPRRCTSSTTRSRGGHQLGRRRDPRACKAGDVDRVVVDLRQQRRRRQYDVRTVLGPPGSGHRPFGHGCSC